MSEFNESAEAILSDEAFLAWYFKTDLHAVNAWEQWMTIYPGNIARVQEAVGLLNSLRFQERNLPGEQIGAAERLLLEKIRQWEKRPRAVVVSMVGRRWRTAAAAVILFVAGLYGAHAWLSHPPEVKTAFGEIREQRLPDGSEVTVNANSTVIYSSGWQDGKDREVWLKGEAFFHVRKTPMKSRFIVHTDHFDVLVTGTQFNVVNRRDMANIMLKEGSVILHTGVGKDLRMAPGDFVEYRGTGLESRQVKKDSVLAWKDQKLEFDNTPLRELVRIIYDNYGVRVTLSNDSIGNKTISGILPNNNLDVLLKSLEATMDFEVIRQGDNITIREHSKPSSIINY